MAAVFTPTTLPLRRPRYRPIPMDRPAPPALRLLPGGRAARSSAAVYRRRRAVAALLAAALATVVWLAAQSVLGAVRPAESLPSPRTASVVGVAPVAPGRTVVVQPGDSLWSIARRARPGRDVRALVDRLAAEHGFGPLRPGERIVLPSR
ncbi:MAG: LysM peptidoglycan-binding domain-containing protein [Actinobacteria bacterium]|nr:LysM peptidoglycan-binding domain-containing protein [Actinomycetota bacterium]